VNPNGGNQRKGAKVQKSQRIAHPAPLDLGVFALRSEAAVTLCLTFFSPQLARAEGVGLRDGTLDLVFGMFIFVWIAAPLLLFLLAFVSFRLSEKLQAHWSRRWSKINLLMTVCTLFAPAIGFVIHAGAKPTFFMGLLSACLALSIATTLMFQIVLLRRRQHEKM
jgi:hypothetical protein